MNIAQQPPAGTALPVGTNAVVFYVDDGNGNTNTCSSTVTVNAVPATPVTISGIVSNPDGSFTISYGGGGGTQFILLQSADVTARGCRLTSAYTNGSTPNSFTVPAAGDSEVFIIQSK